MNDYLKLIFGVCIALLLVSVLCWLWYDWQVAPYRQETEETLQLMRSQQNRGVKSESPTQSDVSEQKSLHSVGTSEQVDVDMGGVPSVKAQREAPVSENAPEILTPGVDVSRFGFGRYPKTPEGWAPIPWHLFQDPDYELMTRVRIKYLEQGVPIVGVTMDKGKVYPIIEGVCYVKWKLKHTSRGTAKHITRLVSTISDGDRLDAIEAANGGILTVSDVPSDIKLIPYDEGGVDPYAFLNLE